MNNHIKVKQRRFEMQVETSDKRSCIADSLLRGEAIVLSKSPKPINRLKGWSSSDTVAYPRCILILTFVCLQTLQRRGPSGSQSSRARASCPQSAGRGRATLHTGHPSFNCTVDGIGQERPLHVSFPKVPPKYWKQWTGQNFEDKCGFISYMDTFRNKIGLCRQILQLVSPNINPSQIHYELRYSPSCILCDLATVPTPATPTPG